MPWCTQLQRFGEKRKRSWLHQLCRPTYLSSMKKKNIDCLISKSSSISCFFLILINTTMSCIPTISITFSSCKLKSHTTISASTTSRQPRSQLQQKIGEPSAHGPTRSSNLYPISTVRLHASACHIWIVSWPHPLPGPRLH